MKRDQMMELFKKIVTKINFDFISYTALIFIYLYILIKLGNPFFLARKQFPCVIYFNFNNGSQSFLYIYIFYFIEWAIEFDPTNGRKYRSIN